MEELWNKSGIIKLLLVVAAIGGLWLYLRRKKSVTVTDNAVLVPKGTSTVTSNPVVISGTSQPVISAEANAQRAASEAAAALSDLQNEQAEAAYLAQQAAIAQRAAAEAAALLSDQQNEAAIVAYAAKSSTGITYYVSTSGNDINDGLTALTPFASIGKAQIMAKAGDVIALKKGNIFKTSKPVAISKGGYEGQPVIYDGSLWGSGDNAVIYPLYDGNDNVGFSAINIRSCSYVVFQNITVNCDNHNLYGIVIGGHNMHSDAPPQNNESYITVQGCRLLNCGRSTYYCLGILIQTWNNNISNITIKGNIVDGVGAEAISIYPGRSNLKGTPAETSDCYIGFNVITNFGRSGSFGEGIQLNNKCTNIIVEHNTISTGAAGSGFGIVIESNEPILGHFPSKIVIRYNKITITELNKFCIFVQMGQAKTADIYGNILIQAHSLTDTDGGGIWISYDWQHSYKGGLFQIYNNTIYTLAGRGYQDDTDIAGTCILENNIIYNAGTQSDIYGNTCCVRVRVAGGTVHNNNAIYRSAGEKYLKVIDSGVYKNTADQVLAWEPTAITGDPLFVIPGVDFRLKSGSPCIKNGVYLGLQYDFDGNSYAYRPAIGALDVLLG